MVTVPTNGTREMVNAIAKLGAITIIALYLVYQVTERQGSQLTRIEDKMTTAQVTMTTVTATELTEIQTNHEILKSLIQVNRQICVNTSKTDDQRRECMK